MNPVINAYNKYIYISLMAMKNLLRRREEEDTKMNHSYSGDMKIYFVDVFNWFTDGELSEAL